MLMAYNASYSGGDIAKAGQNTVTVGIIELGAYMGLLVLAVVIGFLINAFRKMKK